MHLAICEPIHFKLGLMILVCVTLTLIQSHGDA